MRSFGMQPFGQSADLALSGCAQQSCDKRTNIVNNATASREEESRARLA